MNKIILSLTILLCMAFTSINVVYLQNKNKVDKIIRTNSEIYCDLEYLTNNASTIVKGTVESISIPRWNNPSNKKPNNIQLEDTIYQDVRFKVTSVIKGKLNDNKKITVRIFEGKTPDFEIVDNSQPNLSKKEEIYLFLANDDSMYNKEKSDDHYVITGNIQGVFRNSSSTAKKSSSTSIDVNRQLENVHTKINKNEFETKVNYYINFPKPKNIFNNSKSELQAPLHEESGL